MSQTTELQARILSLQQRVGALTINLNSLFNAGATARAAQTAEQIDQLNIEIQDLRQQLTLAQSVNAQGTASSGQFVAEEARARADRAPVSNPPGTAGTVRVTGITDAELAANPPSVEFGTNGRVRPQTQTQATPPTGNGMALPFITGDDDGNPVPGIPTTQVGAAANRDDNTAPNSNRTAQIINASFNKRFTPEPNVLDEYASYTYAITWYLLTPDQYNEMMRSQKKNCASWQLLMQSGGAPTQAAGVTANSTAIAGRNKYFSQDYYIDNLEIVSRIPLKGTGAPSGTLSIKFTVTEPNGITLIDNLYRAVRDLYKQANVTGNATYVAAQYCLVIRFYGYNDSGELVTTGRRGSNGATNLTDPKAIVEKFYPFRLNDILFKIPKDRIVEYNIEGKPIPYFYNKSDDRGTIPLAFELTGQTVEQILSGKPTGPTNPASPGERRDSPQPNTSAPSNPAASAPDANDDFAGQDPGPFPVGV
jgi:hypothetical protein